jgi:hypothetical protein
MYQPKQTSHNTTTPNTIARSEMDNHADTTCFGSNFTAVQFTGKQCEVSPFSEQYDKMANVPVPSAATAWEDTDTGETTILLFHQVLWFGDDLTNSLINPNQCRSHGIDICDDPFDFNRTIGIIDTLTDFTIPMEFGRSFVYFKSQAPTMEEICDNPHIEMTSGFPWDPTTVGQRPLAVARGGGATENSHQGPDRPTYHQCEAG